MLAGRCPAPLPLASARVLGRRRRVLCMFACSAPVNRTEALWRPRREARDPIRRREATSLARQIDKIARKGSQENANKSWLQRNAESMGLIMETSDSEEERVKGHRQRKATSAHLHKLQKELSGLLQHPLQPKTFSRRYLAGAGISPLLQKQLEELAKRNISKKSRKTENKASRFVVIGQDRVEPLQALQNSGQEVCVNLDKQREKRRLAQNWKRKKHEEKKRTREQKRNEKRKAKEMD